jgi:hypothetical protein
LNLRPSGYEHDETVFKKWCANSGFGCLSCSGAIFWCSSLPRCSLFTVALLPVCCLQTQQLKTGIHDRWPKTVAGIMRHRAWVGCGGRKTGQNTTVAWKSRSNRHRGGGAQGSRLIVTTVYGALATTRSGKA